MQGLAIFVTLSVIVVAIISIMIFRLPADLTLLAGLTALLIYGALDPEFGFSVDQGLSGFANPGVLTVAVLFVLADGLRRTGAFDWIGMQLLGVPKSRISAQFRAMIPAAFLSAFVNNTPVVALMMPIISDWSRKHRISVSHLFLPLSYAAILGGTCTLIGTSTTIVIVNLEPQVELSMFELALVGGPALLLGLVFIAASTRWLLPERRPAFTTTDDPREYTVEMVVQSGSPLANKSIEAAGLRRLQGMYLMEINRDGKVIPAVGSETVLQEWDQLVFVGVVSSVVDLQRIPGLEPATDQLFKLDGSRAHRRLVEAVVSTRYPFLRMTVRESEFRSHYNAAIISVNRDSVRLTEKIGDIRLEPGDTLLLEASAGFASQQRNSRHFFLVSEVQDSTPVRHEHAWAARLVMLGFISAASALTWLQVGKATLLASLPAGLLMVLFRCTRASEARRSIDWNIIIVMAAGIGIGEAIQVGETGNFIVEQLTGIIGQNPHAMLIAVFVIASLLTNMITAKAAAVVVFYIAVSAAARLNVDATPFVVAVIMGCAGSFATPYGYQTNMMVYGPGGYHTSDYLRIGVPLTFLVGIITLVIAPLAWPFRPEPAEVQTLQSHRGRQLPLASSAEGGESGIRTRGPRFRRHIISNDAHSATLPSLRCPHRAILPIRTHESKYNLVPSERKSVSNTADVAVMLVRDNGCGWGQM